MRLNEKRPKTYIKITLLAVATLTVITANADWQLDPAASDLYFMSIKATHIGCLLYTYPSPRDKRQARKQASA